MDEAPVRLVVEIGGPADAPVGRVGAGPGEYAEFRGWSSLAAAIQRCRTQPQPQPPSRPSGQHPTP